MKSIANKRAIIVGMFIFLGVAFLIGGILLIGDLHKTFTKKIVVSTIFDDVNGLQQGNNIWFSGVKVGTVNDVSFVGKSQVKVLMKIDKHSKQYIRKNAKVKISSDGLIGNKIIVIYGGTSDAEAVEDGDSLSIERTFTTEDMMNTFQENNKNLLAITTDFKAISKKIANGEGSVGKLLNDESLYNNMQLTLASLRQASANAQQLTASLNEYGSKLKQKGSLANDLVTDTTVFNTVRATVTQLKEISSTASGMVTQLKSDMNNTKTPIGMLLNDEQTATALKSTITNLDSSSQKLNEDLEALQHNMFFRGYFKKKDKEEKKN
ncbi:MAG TPA: MlaD family protein [Chitinophagales bacterium]|nr:MlaD family protein [Chitinophagales bacterium]